MRKKVKVADFEFKQSAPKGLRSVVVENHVDMAALSTIIVGLGESDPGYTFEIGAPVEVAMMEDSIPLFKGELVAVEYSYNISGPPSVLLRAIDHVHRLGRGRKTRFWEKKTDEDVAKEVGAECDLAVESDPTAEVRPYILQRNESNIAFLKRLASRNNFQVRVEGDNLLFKAAEYGGSTEAIKMGENIISLNVNFNSVNQVQKVIVQGWSIKDKREVIGTCAYADIKGIGSGDLGAKVSEIFGESVAYITDIPVSSQKIADDIAKSEMARLARQFCRGKCAVLGNNAVVAGTMVEFSGFSEGLNGKYYVISSRHSINPRSGYTTDFTFCSNTYGK